MLGDKGEAARPSSRALMLALLSGAAFFTTAGGAAAQVKAAVSNELEEVVVTARRVAENLQNVPIAVTALGETALREKAITSPTEVMFNAPSVQMTTAFGRLSGGFSIRGLAGGTQAYFAEVAGGPTEASAPFYDIESVQVLNGPQGTLFGRANTAGAVLVTPKRPALNHLEGSLEVAEGSLGLNRITGVINLPVIDDQLAVRLAVNRTHLDGYTRVLGKSQRLNENSSENARLSVQWRPGSGKFSNYAVLDWYHVDEASGAMVLSAVNPAIGLFNLPANIDAPGGLTTGTATFGAACRAAVGAGLSADLNSCIDQRLRIAATFKPALIAEANRTSQGGDAVRSVPGDPDLDQHETLKKWTFVNHTEYDFGQLGFTTVTLRNIFGYQAVTGVTGWAVDGLGGLIQDSVSVSSVSAYATTPSGQQVGNHAVFTEGPFQKTYSNETQLRGVVGHDLLNWNLGYYYQNTPSIRNLEGIRNLSRVFSGITLATRGFNPSFPFADGGYTRQTAVFGQATADLSRFAPVIAGLHLTGGLRKSWDESELLTRAVSTDLATGRYVPGAQGRSFTKSSGWNYTVSLDGQITDNLLVYVAHRKGYRPGGINQVLNASAFPNFTPNYAPETVKDIELGAKYDFSIWGARGRLNGALYKTEYSDIQRQFSGSVNGVTATYFVNASAAEIKGAELQGEVVAGNWDFSGNYSYSDPKFTKWIGSDPLNLIRPGNARCLPGSNTVICLIDLTSNPFPNISRHQASFTTKYRVPLPERLGQVSVSGTAYYQSRRYFSDAAARTVEQYGEAVRDAISQEAFARYNLRADWRNVYGSDFSLAAFVNNLTDENYALTTVTQLHSLGTAVKLYAEPRTFGVEVRYQFGR